MRKEFERITPEEAGIESSAILDFLDELESGYTEMHGLMIMRHDKIVCEGWWAPYAPGLHHMCFSLTKTYMGTAIGAAIQEGLLSLEESPFDIFPEYAPENPTEYQKALKLKDVLSFSAGMRHFPSMEGNWVKNFLNLELEYEPGTAFFYNSVASTFLGRVIEKVTGKNVYEYLKEKVFGPIGIDPTHIAWGIAPEGSDMWAWRTYSTTEDNLRLMKLYKDGGKADGVRVLPEEYVRLATSLRTENASNSPSPDSSSGYGYQMWMCAYPGAYRADGAGGQFSVVIPDKDMIISINEQAGRDANKTLEAIWKHLIPGVHEDPLPKDEAALKRLKYRLKHAAIEAPEFSPYSERKALFEGRFDVTEGTFDLYVFGMNAQERVPGIVPKQAHKVRLSFEGLKLILEWKASDMTSERLVFAMDGTRYFNTIHSPWEVAERCFSNAYFKTEDTLVLQMLWPEDNSSRTLTVKTVEEGLTISEAIPGHPGREPRINMTKLIREVGNEGR